MDDIKAKIASIDWVKVSASLHDKGYALIPKVLTDDQCDERIEDYSNDSLFRKTVVMERYRFGQGEYKYYNYPLPAIIQTLRERIYPRLAPIANDWMAFLKIKESFPETFEGIQAICHQNGQEQATPLILKYGEGGFNTLHQDLYGELFFPMQAVLFLNEADQDFTGGEFVITQQTPRAQSKAIVLRPKKGDMLIFTTNFRPVKGKRGYYRVNMKHGVSEVISGERHTLGIIFHDATN